MSSGKQYGLQIPKKNLHGLVQKHSVFGDSDSDKSDGGGTDWTKRALKAGEKTTVKRQTKIEMQRAIEEDSSVYQYDEIYDQMQKGKQEKSSRDKERKPKYIEKLMAAAEKRKIENERRIERQVQKEREAEGDEFRDKETFVTSAYKKKLEEFAKLDAEQKRQDMLEEIGDVTKQQDMGGFYRHLYETTVVDKSPAKPASEENSSPRKKEVSAETSPSKTPRDDRERQQANKKTESSKDSRKYRKRKESESSTDKNKDADTDVESSTSSSGSSDSETGEEKSSQSETENPKRLLSKREPVANEPAETEIVTFKEPVQRPPEELQRSIWEKRTVGPAFDAALKRYLERKQSRLAAAS